MKQSTSWKKARNNPPVIFHFYCPLGGACCTDHPFEKMNCGLKETKLCLNESTVQATLKPIFTPGLASDESCQKRKLKKQRWQLKVLEKKKLIEEKRNQHLLVARILFGDLSPQSLLEKERGTVSYRTASVEQRKLKVRIRYAGDPEQQPYISSRSLGMVQDNEFLSYYGNQQMVSLFTSVAIKCAGS